MINMIPGHWASGDWRTPNLRLKSYLFSSFEDPGLFRRESRKIRISRARGNFRKLPPGFSELFGFDDDVDRPEFLGSVLNVCPVGGTIGLRTDVIGIAVSENDFIFPLLRRNSGDRMFRRDRVGNHSAEGQRKN